MRASPLRRGALVSIHRWAGLIAGPLLALLGLSGSLLVFRDEIERGLRGIPAHVGPAGRARLPLQQIAAGALNAYPGARLLYFNLPPAENAPPELVLLPATGRVLLVAMDPFTARPLGLLRGDRTTWLDPIARFHFHVAMAILAAAALLLSATGLFQGGHGLHPRLGQAAAAWLVLWAATGILFHAARPDPAPAPRVFHQSLAPLDTLAEAAQRAIPGAALTYLQLPMDPSSPVTARLRLPGELRANGGNDVHLHPETAAVLRVDLLRDAGYRRLYMNLAALHFGEFGGLPVKLLWALLGFAPFALWLSALRAARR